MRISDWSSDVCSSDLCASLMQVDVTGLADIAPEDPEPEFVDINAKGEIALTLQENNHIVIVNGSDGVILRHFSAGSVDLTDMDTVEEGALTFDGAAFDLLREIGRESCRERVWQ